MDGNAPANSATRGATYVLRRLGKGETHVFSYVDDIAWDKKGRTFAYTVAPGKKSEVVGDVGVFDLGLGKSRTIENKVGKAKFPKVLLSEEGLWLAYTTDRDAVESKKPLLWLYIAPVRTLSSKRVPIPSAEDTVNPSGAIRFTPKSRRLLFATSPKGPSPSPPKSPLTRK